jgi:hypothetical protein
MFGVLLVLVVLAVTIVVIFARVMQGVVAGGASVCPQNVFKMTIRDLWPCAAEQTIQQLGLWPKCVNLPAVYPWSPGYNTLRLNAQLQQQRLPLMIIEPRCELDIVRTIRLAQHKSLKLSVRSGGHCNESFSIYNSIVIALQKMRHVELDECAGTLTCSAGATQGDVFQVLSTAKRSWAFPLAHRHHGNVDPALSTGEVSNVGITGVCSVGGVGFTQRMLGLTIDSITKLRIALANGEIVTATATNAYSDLFVATRGSGGGNYGIITQVQFQLQNVPKLIIFTIQWSDWSQASAVINAWQTLAQTAPNQLSMQLYLVVSSGATVPTVSSAGVYLSRDQSMLTELLAPLLSIPTASVTYENSTFGKETRKFASGRTYYPFNYRRTRFAFVPLSNTGITTLISQVNSVVGIPGTHTIEFDAFGGQVAVPPLSSSAFYARNAIMWVLFSTQWSDQNDQTANLTWSSTIFNAMLPFTSQYVYTGFVMLDLPNYLQSYYGSLLPMLQTTKTKYDPHNFFSFPQSIPTN